MVMKMYKEEKHGLFDYLKLRKEYNTLLNKYETLLSNTKEKCFEVIYNKINDDQSIVRLRKENKMLRQQVKTLKEIVKEEHDGRNNSKNARSKSSTRNKSRSRTKSK